MPEKKDKRPGILFSSDIWRKLTLLADKTRRSRSAMLSVLVEDAYRAEFGTDDLPTDDSESHLYAA